MLGIANATATGKFGHGNPQVCLELHCSAVFLRSLQRVPLLYQPLHYRWNMEADWSLVIVVARDARF